MAFKLGRYETVVTAFAERAAGPGWSNMPVIVIIHDQRDGSLRREWVQPEEHTLAMQTLYDVSEAVHVKMRFAAELLRAPPKFKKRAAKTKRKRG